MTCAIVRTILLSKLGAEDITCEFYKSPCLGQANTAINRQHIPLSNLGIVSLPPPPNPLLRLCVSAQRNRLTSTLTAWKQQLAS